LSESEVIVLVTKSGDLVPIVVISANGESESEHHTAFIRLFESEHADVVRVRIHDVSFIDEWSAEERREHIGPEELREISIVAAVQTPPNATRGTGSSPRSIELWAADVQAMLQKERWSEQELRCYIARRIYHSLMRTTFYGVFEFQQLDRRLTGCSRDDFWRNAQLLAQEGYLDLIEDSSGFSVKATARLVRDVEEFGAPRADVTWKDDFMDRVALYPLLTSDKTAIQSEYQRFVVAKSEQEMRSVFRTVAPIVENVARGVARLGGSKRQLPTLGPVIGELQGGQMVDDSVVSQLRHVLKFSRDLEGHGARLPLSVLRLATAVAFELLPVLGAVAVENSAA